MFSRFSVVYAPEITFEQLEERIVLEDAIDDVLQNRSDCRCQEFMPVQDQLGYYE